MDRLCVCGSLPAVMDDDDLRRAIGIGWTKFYELKKARRFDAFLLRDMGVVRYSGALVKKWLDEGGKPTSRRIG